MPNYSMDNDADYWQAPERFQSFFEAAALIGNKASLFALGDPNNDDTPMAFILKMEPGFILTPHAHPCERLEVIVRGSLQLQGKTYYPGDVLTATANEIYGPKTAGPDGCTTVEVFAKATGAYQRITESPDGVRTTTNLLNNFAAGFTEQIKRHQAITDSRSDKSV